MVIYNDTQKEHRSAVLRIIRKLADARLQLDFDKSEFEGGIIKYLGYLIETRSNSKMGAANKGQRGSWFSWILQLLSSIH